MINPPCRQKAERLTKGIIISNGWLAGKIQLTANRSLFVKQLLIMPR